MYKSNPQSKLSQTKPLTLTSLTLNQTNPNHWIGNSKRLEKEMLECLGGEPFDLPIHLSPNHQNFIIKLIFHHITNSPSFIIKPIFRKETHPPPNHIIIKRIDYRKWKLFADCGYVMDFSERNGDRYLWVLIILVENEGWERLWEVVGEGILPTRGVDRESKGFGRGICLSQAYVDQLKNVICFIIN